MRLFVYSTDSRLLFTTLSPSSRQIIVEFVHTNVAALNGGLGSTESKTNILVPSSATLSNSLAFGLRLAVGENVRLLLESALRLDGQLGRHGCDDSVRRC